MSFSQRHLHQGNDHLYQMITQLGLAEKAQLFEEALREYK